MTDEEFRYMRAVVSNATADDPFVLSRELYEQVEDAHHDRGMLMPMYVKAGDPQSCRPTAEIIIFPTAEQRSRSIGRAWVEHVLGPPPSRGIDPGTSHQ